METTDETSDWVEDTDENDDEEIKEDIKDSSATKKKRRKYVKTSSPYRLRKETPNSAYWRYMVAKEHEYLSYWLKEIGSVAKTAMELEIPELYLRMRLKWCGIKPEVFSARQKRHKRR